MATNLEHREAQDLFRQATNILQLTVKKPEDASLQGQSSPAGYETELSVQVNDYNTIPRGFGTGIPFDNSSNSASPNYQIAVTSVNSQNQTNYNSHQQSSNGGFVDSFNMTTTTPQHTNEYRNNNEDNYDYNADNVGRNFPDYTLAYKKQDVVHDSPGGPDNIRGFVPPKEDYSSKSLPRNVGASAANDTDRFKHLGEPSGYEPSKQYINQNSVNASLWVDVNSGTGTPIQSSPQLPEHIIANPPRKLSQPTSNYNSTPRPFSPSTNSGPASPRTQISNLSNKEPTGNITIKPSSDESTTKGSDHSNIHGSGSNKYSTLPHTKPNYSTNNNIYKSTPQPYSAPKPFVPTGFAVPLSSQPKPFQSQITPASSGFSSVQPPFRKVSFDQNAQDGGAYTLSTSYTARPYRPLDTPVAVSLSNAVHSQQDVNSENTNTDFETTKPNNFLLKASKPEEVYTAVPFMPSNGAASPRSAFTDKQGAASLDPSLVVSDGVSNLSLESTKYQPLPAQAWTAPPPPPPPTGPSPPPAPPLNNGFLTNNKRPNYSQQSEEVQEQKVPDQLLAAMMQSAKGGTPKPFSYGIDLTELKKKVGPPTAPKPPSSGQPNSPAVVDQPEVARQLGGPQKKPVGQIQSDYFIKRDDDNNGVVRKTSKVSAGQMQNDYFLSRQTGPRSEVDESPININMGTDPKKQSKSFKVLQWMTETENDEPEETTQKPRKAKDPERRHNADDDEMRFSGLNKKADIPSKTFGILQRLSSNDETPATQNGKATLEVGDADEVKGNSGETYGKYKGSTIPSPSFRLLQTWAELDPDPTVVTDKTDSRKEPDEHFNNDAISEEMLDKQYRGGNIPSKVFKVLQQSLGDDTSDTSPSLPNYEPSKIDQEASGDNALISEF